MKGIKISVFKLSWWVLLPVWAGIVLLLQSSAGFGAEEAKLMERWLVNDPLSTRAVDHALWAEILESHVVEGPGGRSSFDYAGMGEEDRKKLEEYIGQLQRTDVDRLNQDEQMAFWVNAFNALVVRFALDEYPVKSINDIGGGFFSSGPWDVRVLRVYTINLSLNDIYHRILRPIWQDARVHYVLACAAKGCPDIVSYPYTGPAINRAIEMAAINFVNKGPAIIDTRQGGIRISSIYNWYEDDFGGSEEAVLSHLKEFAEDDLTAMLDGVSRVSGHGFDWSLNDARRQTP